MEIHDHNKVIIVGLEGKIYCTTHLNTTRMEWFLVGVDDKPVEADLDEQQLTLTIDAETAGLNDAMFTCRVTDVEGRQFEESVTLTVKGKIFTWSYTVLTFGKYRAITAVFDLIETVPPCTEMTTNFVLTITGLCKLGLCLYPCKCCFQ